MIEQDIRSWSHKVLEVANPALNGLPACPYAQKAWKENKVSVVETNHIGIETISQANKFENNNYDLVIIASYRFPTPYQFTEFIEFLNDTYSCSDLHIMGFHPEYGAEDAELDFLYDHDWTSSIEKEYAMMFIQSLSQVDDASLKLEKLGYYDVYPHEEYEALVLERRQRRNQQWQ
tara:strand:- start:796 stop:1323 length:528 start_codon:yes stop_codon:yes gene_type:complete